MDQIMQVRCCFQLTSESETSDSIHSNNEAIRLSTSVNIDKNTVLIALVCSNETNNNHIISYYVERKTIVSTTRSQKPTPAVPVSNFNNNEKIGPTSTQSQQNNISSSASNQSTSNISEFQDAILKPRIIVRQIYYHPYNEDIVAICLSDDGEKLVLVNTSSVIYVIQIKNLLLKRKPFTSQKKSMYHYDASIIDSCRLQNPTAVTFWEWGSDNRRQDIIIVGNNQGEISFVGYQSKEEIASTYVNEEIKSLKVIMDCFSYSLLITCAGYVQYKMILEKRSFINTSPSIPKSTGVDTMTNITSSHEPNDMQQSFFGCYSALQEGINEIDNEDASISHLNAKPTRIKFCFQSQPNNGGSHGLGLGAVAAGVQSVLSPIRPSQSSLFSTNSPNSGTDNAIITYHGHLAKYNVSIVDILGAKSRGKEPRQARFYQSKSFYYRPNRPSLIFKFPSLDSSEIILQLILTDRFLAITTDFNRCLVYSRNSCDMRWGNSHDPIVKEITFSADEQILNILKSPLVRDTDNIIDSFFLITRRAVYSIEARRSFRNLYFEVIDNCLGLDIINAQVHHQLQQQQNLPPGNHDNIHTDTVASKLTLTKATDQSKEQDDIYDKITAECQAFSFQFRLEINSLYEAYADRLLRKGYFKLANRFLLLAKFTHTKIVGKYVRLTAYKEAISYVIEVLETDTTDLAQSERIALSKIAFECLLALTLSAKSVALHQNAPDVNVADESVYSYKVSSHELSGTKKYRDCEQFLIQFIVQHVQSSTYSYVMQQLVDFDLVEVAETLCTKRSTHLQTLIRILLNTKGKVRLAFGSDHSQLVEKLLSLNYHDFVILNEKSPIMLKVLTSSKITNAFVNNINLINEYLKYSLKIVLDAELLVVKKLARIFDPRRSITQILLNRVLTRNNDSQSATYWMQDTISTPQVFRQDVLNFFMLVLLIILRNDAPIYDHSYISSSLRKKRSSKPQAVDENKALGYERSSESSIIENRNSTMTSSSSKKNRIAETYPFTEHSFTDSFCQDSIETNESDNNKNLISVNEYHHSIGETTIHSSRSLTPAPRENSSSISRRKKELTYDLSLFESILKGNPSDFNLPVVLDRCLKLSCLQAAAICCEQLRQYTDAARHQLDALARWIYPHNYNKNLVTNEPAESLSITGNQPTKLSYLKYKDIIRDIFLRYMEPALSIQTEASDMWHFYINFYLKNLGSSEDLQEQILTIYKEHINDSRFVLTLYKTISKDEELLKNFQKEDSSKSKEYQTSDSSLDGVFSNSFLMNLLSMTLNDVTRTANLESITDCLGIESGDYVSLPVEHVWRRIFKSIQTTAHLKEENGDMII